MTDDAQKPAPPPIPSEISSADEQPEIYGIAKGKNGVVLNRRSFLGALAAAGALAACPLAIAASKPAASPKTLGSDRAHAGMILGLKLEDNSLSSWDANTFKVWDIAKGALKAALARADLAKIEKQAGSGLLGAFSHIWDSSTATFGADSKTIAKVSKDGVALWRSAEGKPVEETLKGGPKSVFALALHPEGATLAAGGAGPSKGAVTVWDLKDRKAQDIKAVKEHVHSLAFHPKEPVLLSGHSDGKVREWRLPDGESGKTLSCHRGWVKHLKVTPDGRLVVAASSNTIKLLRLSDGKEMASLDILVQGDSFSAMELDAAGLILVAGTSQGRIYLWRLPEGEMIGCLFDPDLLDKGTPMAQYRQMGAQLQTRPCDEPPPAGATCVCDCVAAGRMCGTTRQTCTCDVIAVPAGYAGKGVCTCDTIAVGARTSSAPSCSCVGHVSHGGGSHYWRPN